MPVFRIIFSSYFHSLLVFGSHHACLSEVVSSSKVNMHSSLPLERWPWNIVFLMQANRSLWSFAVPLVLHFCWLTRIKLWVSLFPSPSIGLEYSLFPFSSFVAFKQYPERFVVLALFVLFWQFFPLSQNIPLVPGKVYLLPCYLSSSHGSLSFFLTLLLLVSLFFFPPYAVEWLPSSSFPVSWRTLG